MMSTKKLGSAKVWSDRETVLISGAGGRLGGCIFGMLQRCAPNNIFSGLGEPRGMVGAPKCAVSLNGVLNSCFVGAFAHESMMRMSEWGDDTDASLLGAFAKTYAAPGPSVLVAATRYTRMPIASTSINECDYDFCLDPTPVEPKQKDAFGALDGPVEHTARLERLLSVAGHPDTAIRHVSCVESPGTTLDERAAALAALSGLAEKKGCGVTYLIPEGVATDLTWTFLKGFPATQGGLRVSIAKGLSAAAAAKGSSESQSSEPASVAYSDVAAAVVECLQTLPWDESRVVSLGSAGLEGGQWPPPCDDDSAKVWLVGASRVEAAVQDALSRAS